MKNKLITIFILIVILFGCGSSDNVKIVKTDITLEGFPIKTYTIDSCEYIGYLNTVAHQSFLTHKGNCKFCKTRK